MIPEKAPQGKFRFRMIGGSMQLRIDDVESLRNVLLLDEAFWAMTGADVGAFRFDRVFLDTIDSDHDGHIRSSEVRSAVRFLVDNLKSFDGIFEHSDKISLNSINGSGPDGEELTGSFRLIARSLDKDETLPLSIEEISGYRNASGYSSRNGDGIIAPEASLQEDLRELIAVIIASGRTSADRSGAAGVSVENIASFAEAVKKRCDHADAQAAVMVYGDDTGSWYELFKECEPLLDGYFLNAAAAGFWTVDTASIGKIDCAADLMMPDTVREVLKNAAAAVPTGGELDFAGALNPLYADKLRKLETSPVLTAFCENRRLSADNWLKAKAALAPYGAWENSRPCDDGLDAFPLEKLYLLNNSSLLDELRSLAELDSSFALAVSGSELLLKLVTLQQNILEFLNNFVSMPDLFDTTRPSRLQMGKLIMDGRHFTLAVPVRNAAEHKRIVKTSEICVLYVEISRIDAGNTVKQLLAVAVTGGTMRTLFIGKHGIFVDVGGNMYDARICDMVEQPVSVWEALKEPYFRFGDFIGKSMEKMFNTRNSMIQKDIDKAIALPTAAPGVPGKPAAAVPAAPGVMNLPMLLMGGGIGIAALGSSVAFIAKSLQNVSIWTVLIVLAGIMVIFGGPMVVISLVKLYRRDLSRFLESCGCAVNRHMRLTRRMGGIFTFVPKRPKGDVLLLDPAELLTAVPRCRKFWGWTLAVLALLIVGAVSGLAIKYYWFDTCREVPCQVQKCDGKTPVKGPDAVKKDVPALTGTDGKKPQKTEIVNNAK